MLAFASTGCPQVGQGRSVGPIRQPFFETMRVLSLYGLVALTRRDFLRVFANCERAFAWGGPIGHTSLKQANIWNTCSIFFSY